jgi:hypothetical protein
LGGIAFMSKYSYFISLQIMSPQRTSKQKVNGNRKFKVDNRRMKIVSKTIRHEATLCVYLFKHFEVGNIFFFGRLRQKAKEGINNVT